MDFDIGNIFYIVITIVAVLVGLLGKKKKPADGKPGTQGNEARPGFMENLERILQMGQEGSAVRDLQEFEEDIQIEETLQVQEAEKEHVFGKMDGPNIMDEYDRIMSSNVDGDPDMIMSEGGILTERIDVVDLEQESGANYFEIVRNFDAGTAVIYSAIINRLDY